MSWNETVGLPCDWTLQNLPIISKNSSNEICTELNFQQKLSGRISLSTSGVELVGSKDSHFWNIIMHGNEKVHFRAECRQEYRLYGKMLETKVAQN